MDDPGPRYRRTPHGWEPLNAFTAPSPVPVTGTETLLRLIQETAGLGVPPGRAVKWWTYILASARRARLRP